jgi:probable rRNA maturation factor
VNRVAVNAGEAPLPAWSESLSRYALKALAALGRDNWDLSVLLCGDETIKKLNAQYRGRDEATDVLSFELGVEEAGEDGGKRYLPGDIVISLDTLRENARYFEISEDEELRRLVIHGILHLDGMDHRTNGDAAAGGDDEPMIALQENILAGLGEERILPLAGPALKGEGSRQGAARGGGR